MISGNVHRVLRRICDQTDARSSSYEKCRFGFPFIRLYVISESKLSTERLSFCIELLNYRVCCKSHTIVDRDS